MGRVISITASAQNAIFGIRHENIAERLTEDNWRERAVVRIGAAGPLYLWIEEGRLERLVVFVVSAEGPNSRAFDSDFPALAEALAYANGEDGGRLARETRPAKREEWPGRRPAPWTVGVPFRPGK